MDQLTLVEFFQLLGERDVVIFQLQRMLSQEQERRRKLESELAQLRAGSDAALPASKV